MGEENGSKNSLSQWTNRQTKGGFRASGFIYGLVALENMGFVANAVSMVLYFYLTMHFNISSASNTLTNFMGSTFLLSVFGAFISDTYINRFHTTLIFGFLEIVALMLMTIQAHFPSLQAKTCGKGSCIEGVNSVMFYSTLGLLALGSGGVRGALPALGADQFDRKNPKEAKALGSYFNWLLLSTTTGASVGVTVIVWVGTNKGWWWGFCISLIATFVGFIVLSLGMPFYRLQKPGDSPIIRITQVIVVAIKNRSLSLPESADVLHEIKEKEYALMDQKISHTNQFRWMDKAAVLPNDSKEPTPWTLCTVTQIEEVKILTRMLPIIASTIIMNTCLAQLQTFSVEQGFRMNLFLGSFKVPPSSIPVIPLVFMSILIPLYEFFFVPFARKITNHPSGITQLQRVGVGLVLSAISMAIAGIVEVKRKDKSIKNPLKPISLFWLSFQYGIFGIADMFTMVGLLEFFYREAPAGMKSLSTSFTWISLSFGYFLSSVFVSMINTVTKRVTPSKLGWLHGENLDSNNLDLFYWFLAILSCINFVNYLYWASWYKYKTQDSTVDTEPKSASFNGGIPTLNGAQDDVSKPKNGATEDSTVDIVNHGLPILNRAQDDVSKPTKGDDDDSTFDTSVILNRAQEDVSKPTRGDDDDSSILDTSINRGLPIFDEPKMI